MLRPCMATQNYKKSSCSAQLRGRTHLLTLCSGQCCSQVRRTVGHVIFWATVWGGKRQLSRWGGGSIDISAWEKNKCLKNRSAEIPRVFPRVAQAGEGISARNQSLGIWKSGDFFSGNPDFFFCCMGANWSPYRHLRRAKFIFKHSRRDKLPFLTLAALLNFNSKHSRRAKLQFLTLVAC